MIYKYYCCRSLPKITIPDSVTNIGRDAFLGCLGLLTLSIGKNVTNIGMSAFQSCTNLTDVYCYTNSVPIIENDAFTFNKRKPITSATLHVPANSVDLYKADPLWNGFGSIVALEEEYVTFTEGQMATIILPTTPDAELGTYYKLAKCENDSIIFEEEAEPKAHAPYIIIPKKDFYINLNKIDLQDSSCDSVSVGRITFIGLYKPKEIYCPDGCYIDIIDRTPDCIEAPSYKDKNIIGSLRAYLRVSWEDPYSQGPTRGVKKKKAIVLEDNPNGTTGIGKIQNSKFENQNDDIYDLSGRRITGQGARSKGQENTLQLVKSLKKGIYIIDGKKVLVK